ncbi:FAD dependent oxidoreductase-domain-containing protein [Geopyxis carbonaria]|nr:FAD dependent oxidoreductase-domain-containing protein [Geopyxis carbonaria]
MLDELRLDCDRDPTSSPPRHPSDYQTLTAPPTTTTMANLLPRLLLPLFILLLLCHLTTPVTLPHTPLYDLIILSATPAGIMTAVSHSRLSPTSRILLLERTAHIGGLPANGLGATDISTRGATGGLFLEFVGRIKAHYVATYGAESKQVVDCQDGYHFEPRVAEAVLEGFLDEVPNVRVLRGRQFDAEARNLRWHGDAIAGITVLERDTGRKERYSGKVFVDASYEGDLIGAAGMPLLTGREAQTEYGEIGAGVVYKYWDGPEQLPESTHARDATIQAFNYRVTLTDDPALSVPITKPAIYNRTEYLSLIGDIASGCHTEVQAATLCPRGAPLDPSAVNSTTRPAVPGMPEGIKRLSNTVALPNGKWDGNNQHKAFISTDLPRENWPYPTASWAWRDAFAARLRSYTEGFLYFGMNDPDVPEWFRGDVAGWGLARDEYDDNGNFPRQVYVREGRRLRGRFIFTANNALAGAPVQNTSITASHYALDSHAVRKREPGRVHLDGFISYPTEPYTVPLGVMVPAHRVRNLLAPVPVSGTHVGFSTLRMEPCWMALGQAAGVVAWEAIRTGGAVGEVSVERVQRILLGQGAVLVWTPELPTLGKEEGVRRQWALLHPDDTGRIEVNVGEDVEVDVEVGEDGEVNVESGIQTIWEVQTDGDGPDGNGRL